MRRVLRVVLDDNPWRRYNPTIGSQSLEKEETAGTLSKTVSYERSCMDSENEIVRYQNLNLELHRIHFLNFNYNVLIGRIK